MLLPNTILRDRYRIIHELGHGGMGTVYQAMDENLSCVVAVKETLADSDEQRRAFRREAQLLANLNHPNLPKVMDHFTEGKSEVLVMQFVPGHDLAELIELREQPFAVAKVLDWADQILDALEELHSSKPPIIHRDIKPSNLKVTPRGRVLLLDFGLAKGAAGQMSTADAESRGKSIYGYTPNYAPLEQIRGAGTDARSDLYSLAATLWTLLTGKVPADALTRIGERDDGNPDPLGSASEINPQISKAVAAILSQAMAINRNHRHENASQLRNELRKAQAEFERPTLRRPEQARLEASPPKSLPLNIATPEVAVTPSIKPVPVSTIKALDDDQEPPVTLGTEQSPASADRIVGAPTATSRFGDERKPKNQIQRLALIGSSILALIIAVAFFTFIIWKPKTREQNLNGGGLADISSLDTKPAASNNTASLPVPPAGMVYVPGGTMTMGRNDGDVYERPAHTVIVQPFFIDVYEVTNDEYQRFVQATNQKPPTTWITRFDEPVKAGKPNVSYPNGTGRRPVTGITWDDANAYAVWAGKRLPTEEEWELAARGSSGQLYTWGDTWRAGRANTGKKETSPTEGALKMVDVGTYREGMSQFGTYDMIGNAWEWTKSEFKPSSNSEQYSELNSSLDLKVIRGGCWATPNERATTTLRRGYGAREEKRGYSYTGFRLARDVMGR